MFESIEPTESRKKACRRLAWKVNVKEVTLYNWVKPATPVAGKGSDRSTQRGSVGELRVQVAILKKENRELARANQILKTAASFFGAELDRQSKR